MAAKSTKTTPPIPTAAAAPDPNELVRVYHTNKIGGSLVHGPILDTDPVSGIGKPRLDADGKQLEYKLEPGGFAEVPRSVADIWLTHSHYGAPVCALSLDKVSPAADRLKNERDALADENKQMTTDLDAAGQRIANLEKMIEQLRAGKVPDPVTPPAASA